MLAINEEGILFWVTDPSLIPTFIEAFENFDIDEYDIGRVYEVRGSGKALLISIKGTKADYENVSGYVSDATGLKAAQIADYSKDEINKMIE